jgi:hypothetical protein
LQIEERLKTRSARPYSTVATRWSAKASAERHERIAKAKQSPFGAVISVGRKTDAPLATLPLARRFS